MAPHGDVMWLTKARRVAVAFPWHFLAGVADTVRVNPEDVRVRRRVLEPPSRRTFGSRILGERMLRDVALASQWDVAMTLVPRPVSGVPR